MSKDVISKNEKGQFHGYCEIYFNPQITLKGYFINDKRDGHWLEYYDSAYHRFFYKNDNRYYKNRFIGGGDFETF